MTEMPTSAACSDGRIVDPVSQEADDVTAAFQREDDLVLLRRRDAREDRSLFRDMAQRRIVEAREIWSPVNTSLIVQSDTPADAGARRDRCRLSGS